MAELTVVDAVQRDLDAIAKQDAELARSALAASALALARAMDSDKVSATAKSMCARSLNDTLDRLYERAPEKPKEKTELDDLRAKRRAREAAAASI